MNLAIKGHQKKGKKVIEILEMLGGKNSYDAKGDCINLLYILCDDEIQYMQYTDAKTSVMNIFTLEEFLEKFPYKVGDKVLFGNIDNIVWEIESMQWIGNEIKYIIQDNNKSILCDIKAEDLKPLKEETMEEDKGTLVAIDLTMEFKKANEIEVILGDYEFVLKDGKTYFVKKNKYPKTYEECCKVLDYCGDYFLTTYDNNGNPSVILNILNSISTLTKLLICRNVYWKIAGEQMGLGKDWKPDFLNPTKETRYFIFCTGTTIENGQGLFPTNKILIFPTEEMRDAFEENFKDLIEQCKELL